MADNTFLQAFQVGEGLIGDNLRLDLQRRQLAGQEADRALRARVSAQEMELNAARINEISTKVAQQAKINAARDLVFQDLLRDKAAGIDPAESIVNRVAPLAALEQGGIDDTLRGILNYQREKQEGPLRREKLESEIAENEATAALSNARATHVGEAPQFAPTTTQKNLTALLDAEAKGDAQSAAALRKSLRLDDMSESDRMKYRARLQILASNPLLALDPEKQKAAFAELDQEFFGSKSAGGASAPSSTAPKYRWDASARKLVPLK